ncbi:probable tRNA methyltransferase 9B isoform X2 [Danio rerio]|uniref:Probable tRNA methyltransferase 9B isoform X2 n=2 Tax=Danio rerio TaxID=7955 RepID=A0AC58HA45_DANRE
MDEAASQLEREHVHSVYERIAPYFNDSRYKAWPKVKQFLLEQEPGSIVADIGCGNGKYLHINEEIFKLGCDVCRPLVESAWNKGHEVQICDGLRLPYRDACFDAVLSIAVIHHMSTKERRIRAIKEMARTLRVGGRIMIYVWAMEQKRRKFEKQDIFVPWNPNPPLSPALRGTRQRGDGTQSVSDETASGDKYRKVRSTSSMLDEGDLISPSQQKQQRLWFFSRSLDSVLDFGSLTLSRSSSSTLQTETVENRNRRGSGRGLIRQMSSLFSSSSRTSLEEDVFISDSNETDQSNLEGQEEESSLREPLRRKESSSSLLEVEGMKGEQPKDSCLRYYHVFREGELTQLIQNHVDDLHVLHTFLDHANWCVVAEKIQVWKV